MLKSNENNINIIKKEEIKDEINERIENECENEKEEIQEELESDTKNTLKRKYNENDKKDEITLLNGLIKTENVKKRKKVKTDDKILQMEQEKV